MLPKSRMKIYVSINMTVFYLVLFTSCVTPSLNNPTDIEKPFPDWYYNPADAMEGLNATSCQPVAANNLDVARRQAISTARAEIASQIEVRVKAMDKTYDRISGSNESQATAGVFESVTKQIVNQTLSGVRSVKSQQVSEEGNRYFCTLVNLNPDLTDELISNLIKQAGINLSTNDETVLRDEFKAPKLQ